MFYNTIYYRADELKKAWADAKRQEDLVLYIFKQNPFKKYSPSDIWEFLQYTCDFKGPITSIRRAMTDLTSEGELTMLEEQKEGLWGKPEHLWCLKQLPINGTLF